MQLKQYLKQQKIDPKEFAEKSDISLQNIYYWIRGAYKPNKVYRKLLHEATGGKVSEKDWIKPLKKEP
jgi:predicted transcriptional regulator